MRVAKGREQQALPPPTRSTARCGSPTESPKLLATMAEGGAIAPLPAMPIQGMAGPFPWCNWVVGRQVLAGAYPATLDDEETREILSAILELGICTFVCLQAEVVLDQPETQWRSGMGLRPYLEEATTLLSAHAAQQSPRIPQRRLDLLHLPILDGGVASDRAMERLHDHVRDRVLAGEKIYIHCWGGHGRTGTLVALLLSSLYGLGAQRALAYTQALHDCRANPQGVRSPQTRVQRNQVRRIISFRARQELLAALGRDTLQTGDGLDTAHPSASETLQNPVASVSKASGAGNRHSPLETLDTHFRDVDDEGCGRARGQGVTDHWVAWKELVRSFRVSRLFEGRPKWRSGAPGSGASGAQSPLPACAESAQQSQPVREDISQPPPALENRPQQSGSPPVQRITECPIEATGRKGRDHSSEPEKCDGECRGDKGLRSDEVSDAVRNSAREVETTAITARRTTSHYFVGEPSPPENPQSSQSDSISESCPDSLAPACSATEKPYSGAAPKAFAISVSASGTGRNPATEARKCGSRRTWIEAVAG